MFFKKQVEKKEFFEVLFFYCGRKFHRNQQVAQQPAFLVHAFCSCCFFNIFHIHQLNFLFISM